MTAIITSRNSQI